MNIVFELKVPVKGNYPKLVQQTTGSFSADAYTFLIGVRRILMEAGVELSSESAHLSVRVEETQ